MLKHIAITLDELKHEGLEQRQILRALVACVGDLKQLVDQLPKKG